MSLDGGQGAGGFVGVSSGLAHSLQFLSRNEVVRCRNQDGAECDLLAFADTNGGKYAGRCRATRVLGFRVQGFMSPHSVEFRHMRSP